MKAKETKGICDNCKACAYTDHSTVTHCMEFRSNVNYQQVKVDGCARHKTR